MHIVIMGCGRVGAALAHQLSPLQEHTVSVIDQDPLAFRRLGEDFRGRQVKGVGFDRETLIEAGVEEAGAFAAVSSGDNSNIIAARVARETFNVQRVVARIYDPKRAEVYERLGIPTVATVPWTSSRLMKAVLGESSAEAWRDPSGAVAMVAVIPHEGWIGKRLTELESATGARAGAGQPLRLRAAAARVDGRAVRRQGLHAVHRRQRRVGAHRRRPGPRGGAVMRVAIAGAGAVGRSIARELITKHHQVMLIDKDPAKVGGDRVVGAEWFARATPARSRTSRRPGSRTTTSSSARPATTRPTSSSPLLAKTEFAVRRVVARINHPANEWLFTEAWGVDVAVSTPRVLASLVEEAVEVGDVVRLFGIREGQANLVEMTLPEDAPCSGHPVRDLDLPKDTSLVEHHPRPAGHHPVAGRAARGRRRAAVRRRCPRPRTRCAQAILPG